MTLTDNVDDAIGYDGMDEDLLAMEMNNVLQNTLPAKNKRKRNKSKKKKNADINLPPSTPPNTPAVNEKDVLTSTPPLTLALSNSITNEKKTGKSGSGKKRQYKDKVANAEKIPTPPNSPVYFF